MARSGPGLPADYYSEFHYRKNWGVDGYFQKALFPLIARKAEVPEDPTTYLTWTTRGSPSGRHSH